MKLTVDGQDVYVNVKSIISARMFKDIDYRTESKGDIFIVEIATQNNLGFRLYESINESNAKEMLNKIGSLLEDKEDKTYLDGFKDGTEYALKLIEKK